MKIDPYKHKERYFRWKNQVIQEGIIGINKLNSDIIKNYIFDMEEGVNISNTNKKGGRGHHRLNTCRQKLIQITQFLEQRGIKNITNIERKEITKLFADMRSGTLKNKNGDIYKSTGDYVKDFNAFWNWWRKINRLKEPPITIENIAEDINKNDNKPKWVYLDENQILELCKKAKYEYKVLIMFLFDSGVRAPSELINIKVSDLHNDFSELNIRDEISKTFGRKIKLLLCSNLIKEFVQDKKLSDENYLFEINPQIANKYLQRLGKKILGEKESLAGELYSKITLYDFRHCSCCYWLPRYKSENALKYRFGWKESDKIHYYSELLGMKDTITQDDLFISKDKTEIERRIEKTEAEKKLLQEQIDSMERDMKGILQKTNELDEKLILITRRLKK
jgi:integrase